MNASPKKYAAALSLRKTVVVIVAAVLVAVAAAGWEKTMAKPGSSSQVGVGGGHYTLQPAW
jgi:hypothetical protein